MVFGQVVIGLPGSGKTTYCNGMSKFLNLIRRKVAVINLDPANDALPYECPANIEELIKLSDVMNEHSLGPNGGLVYCMDYLEKNIDWLQSKLTPLLKDHYLLFEFPGQVELFFPHASTKAVIMKLVKKLNLRLSTLISIQVQDLSYLQHNLDHDPRSAKYRKLMKELREVIEDYGLVNFMTLDIQDKESMANLVKLIEKSNGYIFSNIDGSAVEFSKIAVVPVD